jgi:hypothetical protein
MNRFIPLLGLAALLAASTSATRAADLGVLTSLDVCDAVGISGLTISSDNNCLLISGSTYYEFSSGNYGTRFHTLPPLAYTNDADEDQVSVINDQGSPDWYSYAEAYLKLEAVSETDFGPARAVVEFYGYQEHETISDEVTIDDDAKVSLDYAYVQIGDQTVITAGLNDDSIINTDDDDPFDWLGTFNSNLVDAGVAFDNADGGDYTTAGHVITAVTDFGNGWKAGAGLESLDADGSAVGFVSYAGDDAPLTGHISFVAGDVLDGTFDDWAIHSALTAKIENFRARAALALNDTGWWNALFTGEATFDIFTLAATVDGTSEDEIGASASVKADVTDTVTLWGGARFVDSDTTVSDDEGYEIAGRVDYKVTDKVLVGFGLANLWTGANAPNGEQSILDGTAKVTWEPGGGYTGTLEGHINSIGGYKTTFTAEKTFE